LTNCDILQTAEKLRSLVKEIRIAGPRRKSIYLDKTKAYNHNRHRRGSSKG
jgi:hypothetical protein